MPGFGDGELMIDNGYKEDALYQINLQAGIAHLGHQPAERRQELGQGAEGVDKAWHEEDQREVLVAVHGMMLGKQENEQGDADDRDDEEVAGADLMLNPIGAQHAEDKGW